MTVWCDSACNPAEPELFLTGWRTLVRCTMLSGLQGVLQLLCAWQAPLPRIMLTSSGDVGQSACGWRSASGQGPLPRGQDRRSAQCAACRMRKRRRAAKSAPRVTKHDRDRTGPAQPGRLGNKHSSLQLFHLNCACRSAAEAESLASTSTPLVFMSSRCTGSGGNPAGSGGDHETCWLRECLQNR